jgi:hypothetical protein
MKVSYKQPNRSPSSSKHLVNKFEFYHFWYEHTACLIWRYPSPLEKQLFIVDCQHKTQGVLAFNSYCWYVEKSLVELLALEGWNQLSFQIPAMSLWEVCHCTAFLGQSVWQSFVIAVSLFEVEYKPQVDVAAGHSEKNFPCLWTLWAIARVRCAMLWGVLFPGLWKSFILVQYSSESQILFQRLQKESELVKSSGMQHFL